MNWKWPVRILITLAATAAVFFFIAFTYEGGDDQGNRAEPPVIHMPFGPQQPEHDIYPSVWSQNSPAGESWEYKVNCGGDYDTLETCYLWDVDEVRVTTPEGRVHQLEKDFNINDYSGETTRRWVLYGPSEAEELPSTGEYLFEYLRDGEVVHATTEEYTQQNIAYPTNVTWERVEQDIHVQWQPPQGMTSDMWYKVIIWDEDEATPDLFVSEVFDWDASTAVLPAVPLQDGGLYSVNVAVFFPEGYAYSEYEIFRW